jgi:hypothetical protein
MINKDDLIEALKRRIEVPVYGISTLRPYLEDANWDQQVAYNAFMADFHALGGRSSPPASLPTSQDARAGLPANIRGTPVIIHGNQEQQRREAMRLLRAVVNIDRDPNNRIHLTITEAFFTLVLTGWDVEAAAIRWASEDVIRWQIYHHFDHLRASTRAQVDIDERTARLVHFTGRDDWHSIRDFLAAHNQAFMNAVRAWYRSGIPVVRTFGWNMADRLFAGRRVTEDGVARSLMPSDADVIPTHVNGDVWAADETTFLPTGQPPSDPLAQPLADLRRAATKRARGFCLTPEGEPPAVGGILPQYFTIDYLQNGKYVANGFEWKRWYRPELPESEFNQSTKPTFDQHNADHVAALGKWIRQQCSRVEGTIKRNTPQPFSRKEKRLLFELCKSHLEKMLADNPSKTAEDFRPPRIDAAATKKLEVDFNTVFEGKIFPGESDPRRRRLGTALKVKCGRMKKFRTAFGFSRTLKAGEGSGSDSPEWSDEEIQPARSQIPRPQLTIAPMQSTAEQMAAAVHQANRTEEAANTTIDIDADELIRRMRAYAEEVADEDEAVDALMRTYLRQGLVTQGIPAESRAVVRHVMRRLQMAVPGEAAADHASTSGPAYEASPATLSGRDIALQRRRANLAEEAAILDIDTRAEAHRRFLRGEAHQHYSDSGSLFPSEAEVANRVRLALHAELRDGKITSQHAAVVRRLLRMLGMVPSEEADAWDDDEEMEEVDEAAQGSVNETELSDEDGDVEEARKGKTKVDEAVAKGPEVEDETSDLEDLDFTDCFPDDVLGLEED